MENVTLKKIVILLLSFLVVTFVANAQNGGYSLDFNGTNQYVSVPNNAAFNVSAITIEAWFYWKGNYVEFITGKDIEGFEMHTTTDNRIRFIPATGVYLDTPEGSIAKNEWIHVSCSFDPSTSPYATIYINGVEQSWTKAGEGLITTPIDNTTDPFLIALRQDASYPFTGKIDEVRVWNDVRTADEVRANMYSELAGNETGLVAYYKMSDAAGTIVSDNGPNNLDGTTVNAPYWQTSGALAGSRRALDFDGTNDFIQLPSNANFNYSGSSVLTFETWVKYEGSSSTALFGKYGSGISTLQMALYIDAANDKVKLMMDRFSDGGWQLVFTSNLEIPEGEWVHIALVKTATTATLYINGKLDIIGAIDATRQNASSSTGVTRIGSSIYADYSQKIMDEVRIWNDARTEAEIRENMMKNMIGNEANLVAYYNFNDGEGNTAHDLTSNGLHGTLTNMEDADWVTSGAFNMWIGNESNLSNNAVNWSDGVPGTNSNVNIVPFNLSFSQPAISSPTFNHFYTNLGALHSNINVNGNLLLNYLVSLNGQTVTLGPNAYLCETENGIFYGSSGMITTTRNLSGITAENVGGLGAFITTTEDMGSTTINRRYGNNSIFTGSSLLRAYDINPANNSGLNATLVFSYSDQDLNGRTESELALYKSTNSGTTWNGEGGIAVPATNTITLIGINSFSRWAASDVDIPITLSTTPITSIGNTTAMSGGEITDDGGLNISVSGICWNTSGTPTTADSKTTDGATSETSFSSQLTALSPYQIYYVRAYATNASGTYYGNEVSFTTVPTLGEWGLIALGSLFAIGGGFLVWRRFVV